MILVEEEVRLLVLFKIRMEIEAAGRTMNFFNLEDVDEFSIETTQAPQTSHDVLESFVDEATIDPNLLNIEQREVYFACLQDEPQLIMHDDTGGTGKTYAIRCLIQEVL